MLTSSAVCFVSDFFVLWYVFYEDNKQLRISRYRPINTQAEYSIDGRSEQCVFDFHHILDLIVALYTTLFEHNGNDLSHSQLGCVDLSTYRTEVSLFAAWDDTRWGTVYSVYIHCVLLSIGGVFGVSE